jgi:hypothetical protein
MIHAFTEAVDVGGRYSSSLATHWLFQVWKKANTYVREGTT